MSVRPLAHASADQKAQLYSRKVIGINKRSPTEGSKTQQRKANKANHMAGTKQFK